MAKQIPFLRPAAAAAGLVALACAAPAFAARDVVLAIGGQPETLDPYNTSTTLTQAVTKSFYQGLFQFDKDLKIQNVLAESYTVSKDGLVYTVELRKGVKFHDGTDFNAEAVKANLERAINPENKLVSYNRFNRISKIEVAGPHTVRIVLKEPFAPLVNYLAHPNAAMISPAALKKYGKEIAFNPVGTGPYTFVEWKQTDFVKAKKFDGFWKKGYPKVDTVTWKPVLENNTRAAMLQTGETDFAFPLPYEQADALKKNQKLNVITGPSIITRYISFNMLQKPLDNLKVRQAIGYAINKEALAKVAFGGYAFPAEGVVPQGVKYAHKLPAWPYDPKKARELLKEAGYPNGFETVLWSAYTTTTAQKTIQFVQQQLGQVGIKVSLLALEPGQRTEWVFAAPDPQTARVRMYYGGWSASTGEADLAMRGVFATESWPPKANNTAYYSNAKVDASIAGAVKSTDEKEKTQLYRDAQEQIMKDMVWVPLVTERNLYATSKRVNGVYVMPDGNINIDEIAVSD